MKYTKGRIGRVFLLKFDDGDILIKEIKKLAKKENVESGVFLLLGALKKGDLVTGPRRCLIPPQANHKRFRGGWEVVGTGTLFAAKTGSEVHIHASLGRKDKVLTGCLRGETEVFLVVEALLFELKGIKAAKAMDPKTAVNLLRLLP